MCRLPCLREVENDKRLTFWNKEKHGCELAQNHRTISVMLNVGQNQKEYLNLIGIKKVGWSIFEDVSTIPSNFVEDFDNVNGKRNLI